MNGHCGQYNKGSNQIYGQYRIVYSVCPVWSMAILKLTLDVIVKIKNILYTVIYRIALFLHYLVFNLVIWLDFVLTKQIEF